MPVPGNSRFLWILLAASFVLAACEATPTPSTYTDTGTWQFGGTDTHDADDDAADVADADDDVPDTAGEDADAVDGAADAPVEVTPIAPPVDCPTSLGCLHEGLCAEADDKCVAASHADCSASTLCL